MPKIQVTMKDPDSLYDAVRTAVREELKNTELDEDEQETVQELREGKYHEVCNKWFEYGEYLTIEIDTDTKEARVISVAELAQTRR